MDFVEKNLQIICPVRGQLKVSRKSKDGLTTSEEAFRVEAIRYLISKGYPKENFYIEPVISKFGNSGRNSFRSDFAVLDIPKAELTSHEPDELLKHAVLLCEVKRDNAKKDYVKETQVKPMLNFSSNLKTIGLYWDNIDRRVFWTDIEGTEKVIKEGPLSMLPKYGDGIQTVPLTYSTIEPTDSLIEIFDEIEDILHQASKSPESRYEIILQLLLAKIYDEKSHEKKPAEALDIQDYISLGNTPAQAKKKLNTVVAQGVKYYSHHLPKKVGEELSLTGDTIGQIAEILAPIKITHSNREVIQTFYMKFAKDLYKWDMAQYFTPTTVTDFLVDILNLQFSDAVVDPACGSADFLVAAFRTLREMGSDAKDSIFGMDNSQNAVQVAILNMVLNGDGKSNIYEVDSLEKVDEYLEKYDVVTCNPPFGSKIQEKRTSILKNFDLGHEHYKSDSGEYVHNKNKVLKKEETGLLFAELCIKICKPGGRIAIILPNGYLGNKSPKFEAFRAWLLRHAKIAAILSLPRFTFKSSGADVSASVLYLEKRIKPLHHLPKKEDNYNVSVEIVENLGWEAGNKKAKPIFKRDPEDGSPIMDEYGRLQLLCDFPIITDKIHRSLAACDFEWLGKGHEAGTCEDANTINIQEIISDPDLTMDPKRYSYKVRRLRSAILKGNYFTVGDVVDFMPEGFSSENKKVKRVSEKLYRYVELEKIMQGTYDYNELRGWELPSRARHFAEPGDFYIGGIWGSVSKWCYIADGEENLVVTNGCLRCRIKEGKEEYLPDLLAYMNTEGWAVQGRSMARGSDGLAEISESDMKQILIPMLSEEGRKAVLPIIDTLKAGRTSFKAVVSGLVKENKVDYFEPEKRPSHIVLV